MERKILNILIDEQRLLFHLQGDDTSYIVQVVNGVLVHLYWGHKLRESGNLADLPNVPTHTNLDQISQEYPQYGSGDFRSPAYQAQLTDGSRITELVYKSHAVSRGKPRLEGLPAVYTESDAEAQTLEITLEDHYSGLTVVLAYSVFAGSN